MFVELIADNISSLFSSESINIAVMFDVLQVQVDIYKMSTFLLLLIYCTSHVMLTSQSDVFTSSVEVDLLYKRQHVITEFLQQTLDDANIELTYITE